MMALGPALSSPARSSSRLTLLPARGSFARTALAVLLAVFAPEVTWVSADLQVLARDSGSMVLGWTSKF